MKRLPLVLFLLLFFSSSQYISFAQTGGWHKLESIYGKPIKDIKVMPSGSVAALTFNDGLFLCYDEGGNWKRILPKSETQWESLNNMCIGEDGEINVLISKEVIKRSTDYGETWKEITNLPSSNISTLTSDASGTLFILADLGVFKSVDEGNTWKKILAVGTDLMYGTTPVFKVFDKKIFAYTNYGLFISSDYGNTWLQVKLKGSYSKSLAYVDENEFYISLTTSYPFDNAIYRTFDGGHNWTVVDDGLPQDCDLSITSTYDSKLLVGANKGRIYESTDKGNTWNLLYRDSILDAIEVISNNSKDVYAYGNGIIKSSNNGKDWVRTNNGLGVVYPAGLIELDNKTLLFNNSFGVYIYSKSSKQFSKLDNEIVGGDVRVLTRLEDKSIVIGNFNGEILRSYDNAKTWNKSRSPNVNGIAVFVQNKKDYLFLGSYGGDTYYSKDNGVTWESLGYWGYITKFVLDPNDKLFVTTGRFLNVWDEEENKLLPLKDFIFRGDEISAIGNNLYVFDYNGLVKSTDCGNTWIHLNKNEFGLNDNEYIQSVCEVNQSHLMLGTDTGLFESTDNGTTWDKSNSELGSYKIRSLYHGESGIIYASTDQGLFELHPDITSSKQTNLITEYKLEQNYPNPFNPSTTISFSIPKTSFVTLKIYNTIGQEVTQLISQEMNAGTHTFIWNAGNSAAGIYYCRMIAGNYTETIKLMLLK